MGKKNHQWLIWLFNCLVYFPNFKLRLLSCAIHIAKIKYFELFSDLIWKKHCSYLLGFTIVLFILKLRIIFLLGKKNHQWLIWLFNCLVYFPNFKLRLLSCAIHIAKIKYFELFSDLIWKKHCSYLLGFTIVLFILKLRIIFLLGKKNHQWLIWLFNCLVYFPNFKLRLLSCAIHMAKIKNFELFSDLIWKKHCSYLLGFTIVLFILKLRIIFLLGEKNHQWLIWLFNCLVYFPNFKLRLLSCAIHIAKIKNFELFSDLIWKKKMQLFTWLHNCLVYLEVKNNFSFGKKTTNG